MAKKDETFTHLFYKGIEIKKFDKIDILRITGWSTAMDLFMDSCRSLQSLLFFKL